MKTTAARTFIRFALGALLGLGLALPALAAIDLVGDDTDLFTTNPNIPSQIPNVLILLDNTSNWSAANQGWAAYPISGQTCNNSTLYPTTYLASGKDKQGDNELCALWTVINTLDEQVNVGLMMMNDNNKGGYVRYAVRPMNSTNKVGYQQALQSISNHGVNDPTEKGASNAAYDPMLNDAFRYFNSFATYTGVASDVNSYRDSGGYETGNTAKFKFLTNTTDNGCGYDYIIFVGNTFPNAANLTPDITNAAALLNDSTVTVDTSTLDTSGRTAANWSKFMFQYGVKISSGVYRHITTYSIDVCLDHCDSGQANLLGSMATVSQGKYFKATSLSAIQTAFSQIFAEVQAVNSVFAATTLPVSINVRGTNLNQVYIGVFRPDPALSPRWLGNLKQYKLGVTNTTTGQLSLVDANDTTAVNLNTGFVANTAKSIWTETSTFFSYRSPYPQTDVGGASDSPDGDLVEKGGAAEKIRQFYSSPDTTTAMTRNIYTCTGTCTSGSSLKNYLFNSSNTNITAALLGTFASQSVTSLTGSGTTASATTSSAHGFAVGNSIVIAGATPSSYNGSFTVATVPSTTTFTYTLSGAVNTTTAYVTLPNWNTSSSGLGLTAGTDTVTVTNATPTSYNLASQAITAVSSSQFSYPIASTTTAASGYTVTANRRVTSLIYNSTTGKATATVPNHGYASNTTGSVSLATSAVIAGATPTQFNGTFATISNVTTNSFDYVPTTTPTGGTVTTAVATYPASADTTVANMALTASTSILTVAGSSAASFNTAACSTSRTANLVSFDTTARTITYTPTGSTVTGTPSGTITLSNCATADIDTYAISTGTAANGSFTVTIAVGTSAVPGQSIHPIAAGDKVAITGFACSRGCTSTNSTTYSFTVSSVNPSTGTCGVSGTCVVTLPTVNNGSNSVTTSTGSMFWTGVTSSPNVTLTSLVAGASTVTGSGTITSTVTGDLTSKVTSITTQGVATGTITAALSTSADTAERQHLIDWVRGQDNKDDENLNGSTSDVRMSVHGDVLHSRPAVVNYNRNGDDNDVYIFYGSNDGHLRAIKGGSLATGGGKEQWTFVAPEFFGKLKRLRDQTPVISPSVPRDYFFDGPISVYTLDADKNGKIEKTDSNGNATGDKVYLFIGMRRGGRTYYAIDVTDPLDPKLLWKKGCSESTGSGTATGSGGCDTGFGEIGQSWSQPALGYLRKWPTTLAMIFAAGHDKTVDDPQPCFVTGWGTTTVTYKAGAVVPTPLDVSKCPPSSSGTTTTVTRSMGRGVFILNATTGAILWRAGPDAAATKQVTEMNYAMPGDIAAMKNRSNTGARSSDIGTESVPTGYFDRLYVGDTGGNLWRIDVADSSGDSSTAPAFAVSKLASVARAAASGSHAALNYRKLMFAPDVVYSSDSNGAFDAVLIGSGDREHPFDMVVSNRFYMFKDRNTGSLASTDIDTTSTDTTVRWAAPTVGIILDSSDTIASPSTTPLFDVTNNCIGTSLSPAQSGTCASGQTATQAKTDLLAAKGWKYLYPNTGEKTIGPGTTAAGTVIFNTNQPKQDTVSGASSNTGSTAGANQCTSDLGTARQYGLNYANASSGAIFGTLPSQYVPSSGGGRFAVFAGGGFLPTPVPVVVQIGGKYYQTVIAGVQTTNPGGLTLQRRIRTYYYKKID